MITVITGVPGSGKTAYCVEKLLLPIAGKLETAIDPDGKTVKFERKIYTNINGLLLDHELITADHLNTWHEWVKPGDLVVYDEFQKPWPKVAMGSKKPACIEALETHRHMGVDFILISQHPNLFHSAVTELAGRHLHVRKLGNSRFATVYEWDGVSRTLLYKNSMAKAPWRRSKKAELAYKSSSLHTKQKRAAPSLLYGVAFGLVAMFILGPMAYSRIQDRIHPPPVVAKALPAPSKPVPLAPLSQTAASAPAGQSTPPPPVTAPAVVKLAGCASMSGRCTCFLTDGTPAAAEPEMCLANVGNDRPEKLARIPDSLPEYLPKPPPAGWAGWSVESKPRPTGNTLGDVIASYR